MEAILNFIFELGQKFPVIENVLAVLAVIAVILPMGFDIFKAIAKATKTKKDDLLVEKIEGSKTYVIVLKILLAIKAKKK